MATARSVGDARAHGRAHVVRVVALLALAGAALAATAGGAAAAPAACRAPAPRHAVVTTVRGMPCGEAVADLGAYRRPFAVSFRTPGGFTCARTFRNRRAGGFRCANGARVYRFRVSGALRPAVRVFGGGFDGTFSVSRCRTRGARAVALTARAPGLRLTMRAAGGRPGTLRLTNHDPENGIDATGSVTALRISRGGAVAAAGRFVAGGTATFRVVGDCR
jgi:hypothetical protein